MVHNKVASRTEADVMERLCGGVVAAYCKKNIFLLFVGNIFSFCGGVPVGFDFIKKPFDFTGFLPQKILSSEVLLNVFRTRKSENQTVPPFLIY